MEPGTSKTKRVGGFRRAVLRGLGVVLPPLLTIVVLIWAWNTIESYVLRPIETFVRYRVVSVVEKTKQVVPEGAIKTGDRLLDGFVYEGDTYVPDPTGRRFLPDYVKKLVDENAGSFGTASPAPARRTRSRCSRASR